MRGLWAAGLLVALFVAGMTAGSLRADTTTPAETTTTATTTTVDTTTTAETTTMATTTEATTTTTTVATTTTVPATTTTAATTTAPDTTTTTAATTRRKPAPAGPCLSVGGVAVVAPGGAARVLGPVARAAPTARHVVGGGVGAAVASAASIDLHTTACGPKSSATATVRSLSLFGGAVTARQVVLVVHGPGSRIDGLAVGGVAVAAGAGTRVPVGDWGYAVAFADGSALAVHLLRAHGGLPPGSVVAAAFSSLPQPSAVPVARARATKAGIRRAAAAARHRARVMAEASRRRTLVALGAPLTATPPLGVRRYVFPVVGESDYGDSYGAFRGDVPGSWHHGDDIFALLGTPVVAVATGTLNRVGWEHLGGWRLWVRDRRGNEFYYAHLSGYSELALHSKYVRAGDVVGFIGNTGDAFTTPPHLHFEVHPHQLLFLGYNGAVNPTGYLNGWPHLASVSTPRPVHPGFPPGAVRQEASYVWRELLAARGITRHAPSPKDEPHIALPSLLGALDAAPFGLPDTNLGAAARTGSRLPAPLLAGLLAALAAAAGGGLVLVRRRALEPVPADEPRLAEAVERLAAVVRSLRGSTRSTRLRRR
jgi:hypothetical protein